MPLPQARVGDIGIGVCCCHDVCISVSGQIVSGTSFIISSGAPAARATDIVIGSCGHSGVIVTAGQKFMVAGLGSARVSDRFSGCFTGIIVSGSPALLVA